MRSRFLLILGAFLVLLAPDASAQKIGLAAHVGTLGPGLELTGNLVPRLNLRIGGNYLPYTVEEQAIEVQSDVNVYAGGPVKMAGASALLDWHPWGNALRLSTGVYYNASSADITMRMKENYDMEGYTLTPAKIGKIKADLSFKSALNPYLGIGIGNAARSRFGFNLDIGGLYTNAFAIDMTGDGLIAPTANQDQDLEKGFSSFRFYPVVSLGFSVKLL